MARRLRLREAFRRIFEGDPTEASTWRDRTFFSQAVELELAKPVVSSYLQRPDLFKHAFFVAMAVTIMFGLGFATVLTLIVVPVLYAIFFRVPKPEAA